MPLVRVRILHGTTQLAAPSRPFAADATLHDVVGKALEPFAEYMVNVLEVFPAADEAPMKKSEFFPDDFKNITLLEITSMGFFWVARVRRTDGFTTPAAKAGPSSSGIGSSSVSAPLCAPYRGARRARRRKKCPREKFSNRAAKRGAHSPCVPQAMGNIDFVLTALLPSPDLHTWCPSIVVWG